MKQYSPVTGERSAPRRMRSYTWIRAGPSQVDARSHARLAHVFHQRRDKNALTYHDYQAARTNQHRDYSTRRESIRIFRLITPRDFISSSHSAPAAPRTPPRIVDSSCGADDNAGTMMDRGGGEAEGELVGRLRCSRQ